ncbi:hypothetical protein FKM82_006465 [Ascaphus truei]
MLYAFFLFDFRCFKCYITPFLELFVLSEVLHWNLLLRIYPLNGHCSHKIGSDLGDLCRLYSVEFKYWHTKPSYRLGYSFLESCQPFITESSINSIAACLSFQKLLKAVA